MLILFALAWFALSILCAFVFGQMFGIVETFIFVGVAFLVDAYREM